MPNGRTASIEILIRCASYRFYFGDWPTRLHIGAFELACLAREMPSPAEFMRFAQRLEIVIRQDWDADDAHEMALGERSALPESVVRFPIEVSGQAGTVPLEEALIPTMRTRAELARFDLNMREVREWFGFKQAGEHGVPADPRTRRRPTW